MCVKHKRLQVVRFWVMFVILYTELKILVTKLQIVFPFGLTMLVFLIDLDDEAAVQLLSLNLSMYVTRNTVPYGFSNDTCPTCYTLADAYKDQLSAYKRTKPLYVNEMYAHNKRVNQYLLEVGLDDRSKQLMQREK